MNPIRCDGCSNPENQVTISSEDLREKSADDIFGALQNREYVLHIASNFFARSAYLHFGSALNCNYFYNKYISSGVNVGGAICEVRQRLPQSSPQDQDWRGHLEQALAILEVESEKEMEKIHQKDEEIRQLVLERDELMEKLRELERRKRRG